MLSLKELINNPERMDRTTLYELRSTLALYPYFQTARLLMIKNLYILHDPSFDEELRRAAIYITDRKVLFQMTEAAYYQLRTSTSTTSTQKVQQTDENRTMDLIDNFLEALSDESEPQTPHRRPTPADAAVDYVAYLLATEGNSEKQDETPQMKGQDLIDNFLNQEQGRIKLSELPDDAPIETPAANEQEEEVEEEYFTETLARIYIKQGRYQKALDIIDRLSKQFPQKNHYFADQKRFLEKLIINNKKQK